MAVLLACKIGGIRPKWIWQQDQQIGKTNALTKRFSRVRCVGMVFDRLVATYDGGKISLIMRGVPAAKISIIRNSVSEYRPLRPKGWLRNELRLAPGCALIVVVSSLIPRKRVNFALRVFTQAFGSGSEGKGRGVLLIVGVGSEESALRDLTLKWGIGELVHFLGRRDDVREILSESDLLLHTSMAEASCYAVVESMAAGIPAVVTDAGAAREMIQDGISGYVLDMDDVEGFSERLAGLAHDAEARRQMGRMAKQRWEQRHKVEDSALQYHALYRTVMNGGSAP
jgi:glycosyltransferase involved in cell wall biosynthesis